MIFTDFEMPEMNGIKLASEVRARGGTIPIVGLTGHEAEEVRQRGVASGMN